MNENTGKLYHFILKSTFGIFREYLFFRTMAQTKYISHSLFPDEYLLKTNLCPRVNPSLFGYSGYFPLLAKKRHEKEISHQIHLVDLFWFSLQRSFAGRCWGGGWNRVGSSFPAGVQTAHQTAANTLNFIFLNKMCGFPTLIEVYEKRRNNGTPLQTPKKKRQ